MTEFSLKAWLMGFMGALLLMVAPLRAQDPPPEDEGGAPDDSVSFQTFYDSLSNQGSWVQSSDYGYVWQPNVDDPDWAPYTDGHWVYTDDGWTWVSDESWGWATYHYGRWVNIDGTGWCWVPGYVWAPAWVSWRYGDDYCGWAPLPPDSFVGIDYGDGGYSIGVGFHIGGDCDGFFGIGAGCYHFVPVNCLGYRNYHHYYANRHDNFAIINRTRNVTNINFSRNGQNHFHAVTMGGPSLSQVNAISQTPVQHVNLVTARQPGRATLGNNSLAVYAPHVSAQASQNARPGSVNRSLDHATINRGLDINRPLAVNGRMAPAMPSAEQVQRAQQAQASAPPGAKVMTSQGAFKPALAAPLPSMQPVTSAGNFHRQANGPGSGYHSTAPSNAGGVAPVNSTPRMFYNGHPGTPAQSPPAYHSATPFAPVPPQQQQQFSPSHSPGPSGGGGGNVPQHSSGGGGGGNGGGQHSGGQGGGNGGGGRNQQGH